MATYVVLDAGPLGLLSLPRDTPTSRQCNRWMLDLQARGIVVAIPAIAYYEVGREVLRLRKINQFRALANLKNSLPFLPLSEAIMDRAMVMWAEVRQQGRQTAQDAALDGDVILAATAEALTRVGHQVVLATTNLKHLTLFGDARLWSDATQWQHVP